MIIPEIVVYSCVIVYIVLEFSTKLTLRSKFRLVPVTFIQHSSIFLLPMAFLMYPHGSKDSTCALNSDTLNFGFHMFDVSFSTA